MVIDEDPVGITTPEINMSPVQDTPLTRSSCRSSVYYTLLNSNESCLSYIKSWRTVTDDRGLFHALGLTCSPKLRFLSFDYVLDQHLWFLKYYPTRSNKTSIQYTMDPGRQIYLSNNLKKIGQKWFLNKIKKNFRNRILGKTKFWEKTPKGQKND